jgi:TonB-dependent starch-binding outer membrane protein SusC
MYQTRRSQAVRTLSFLVATLLVAATSLTAQTGTITGRVISEETTQPIAAAQVAITALSLGALTQQDGRFTLTNVPAGAHTVVVSRLGYDEVTTQITVAAGQSVTRDFELSERALALDQIVITGTAGGAARRAIGNTVASVPVTAVIQEVAITNMQELLSGRTPGVQFTALTGSVGAGSPIQLRGVSSFSGSRTQPLIYVDGVRVNNATNAGPVLGQGSSVSVLDDFNPEDIESVEIIKGPAAASLYGTEASAGVIQIITKRGREGEPQFNASIRQGMNFMPDPAARLGTMWTCPTDDAPGPTECQNESDLVPYNMYEEANRYIAEGYFPWPEETLFTRGHAMGYNLDVSGAAQSIRYFVSANYDKEEGFVWYNDDETFRLRANVGVVFNDKLTMDVSTGYVDGWTRFEGATTGDGGIWQDLVWSNGFYLDRITPFGAPKSDPRRGGFQEHLPSDVAETEATRDYSRFTGSTTLNFQSGDLEFGANRASVTSRAVVGIDKGWDVNINYFPREDYIVPEHLSAFLNRWDSVYSETATGEMTYSRPITSVFTVDYGLTGTLNLGSRIELASSFGAQYYQNIEDRFTNQGNGFASTLSRTINQLSQPQITTSYSYVENKSLGFYFDQRFALNDRFFLNGGFRFDDNSTFGADAPALIYPKFSGTWTLSDESFWPLDVMNSFRVRGAWGQAGRQPNSLSSVNTYVSIPGPGGTPAIRPASPGNPKIEPEVSTELELGFDMAVLDDRLSGTFTRFWRKNEQQLLGIDVPSSFGLPGSLDSNLGRIDNWGWEAQLSARLVNSQAFSLDLDLGADHTDNEIIDLGSYPGTASIRIGLSYPNVTVGERVVSAEFDQTIGPTILTSAFGKRVRALCDPGIRLAPEGATNVAQYGLVMGGEPIDCIQAQNLDLVVGKGFATHSFSVSPRIGLFNNQVQIFALAEGQYGRTNVDNGHSWCHNYNCSKASRLENDPVWVAGDRLTGTGNDFGKSIYKADFWKLRELGARINLPQNIVRRVGGNSASLALSARNFWLIWQAQKEIYGLPITDPEYGNVTALGGGGNFYSTPPLASVNATLRFSF